MGAHAFQIGEHLNGCLVLVHYLSVQQDGHYDAQAAWPELKRFDVSKLQVFLNVVVHQNHLDEEACYYLFDVMVVH